MNEIIDAVKDRIPNEYAYDIARDLQIDELTMMRARVGTDAVALSVPDVKAFIAALEGCGEVRGITRNEYAISVQTGVFTNQYLNGYRQMSVSAEAGLILNPGGLDLRIFFRHWKNFFFLRDEKPNRTLESIQIFDDAGRAVHKIYATQHTNMPAFKALVESYRCTDETAKAHIESAAPRGMPHSHPGADRHSALEQSISEEWRSMSDPHDFYLLMRKHGKSRQELYRCVEPDLAREVAADSLMDVLTESKIRDVSLAIFVSNAGCVQISTGKVEKLARDAQYLNVLNKQYRLHVEHERIDRCWVVSKPSDCGYVTSLEVFAKDGQLILQIYGQRAEHEPEQPGWRVILAGCMSV
ncbi:ChuX/HutX family heme-like substrate-binding protein [Caballeronia sp. LZ035]|uniref:ChuX/HutX family heme-like substrate-binding protein n=1 Tax=Caballeronia sp. LZ035 TaxID=3038568 RepID=UPI0028565103|nr:ChuX/HutX family heme-like substrate-binding protein [Caballeronia sp. LZ035]MDR5760118.1 ChuX/HutX family heme-like substrate-binding protein [Caballeronia sp. LZ035]